MTLLSRFGYNLNIEKPENQPEDHQKSNASIKQGQNAEIKRPSSKNINIESSPEKHEVIASISKQIEIVSSDKIIHSNQK